MSGFDTKYAVCPWMFFSRDLRLYIIMMPPRRKRTKTGTRDHVGFAVYEPQCATEQESNSSKWHIAAIMLHYSSLATILALWSRRQAKIPMPIPCGHAIPIHCCPRSASHPMALGRLDLHCRRQKIAEIPAEVSRRSAHQPTGTGC